ncbi:MAG TPA: hypothetical protein VN626_06725 [Clostridia bacterium]|nr:hypothetical protein [Clostridia bacterium]
MIKSKKNIRVAFWVIVLSGSLLLGIVTAALDIGGATKNALVIIWLSTLAFASIAIDLLWYRAFNQQMKALQPILLEERNPDRYIQEISGLLEGKKSPRLRGILLINLCAAYCEKREYDTAKTLLLQIDPKKLASLNRLVFWADLAYVHFHLHEDAQACAILAKQEKLLFKLREHPHVGGLMTILFVFQKVAQGDKAEARALLEQARPKWQTARNAHDFDYLEQLC